MQKNGLTIPDSSRTIETIIDPIGGVVYTVMTTVEVSEQPLVDVTYDLEEARKKVAELEALDAEIKSAQAEAKASSEEPVAEPVDEPTK